MNPMRLLWNVVLYMAVTMIMELYRSGGSLSLDGNELLGRAAAGVVFAVLFEALSSFSPKFSGRGKK